MRANTRAVTRVEIKPSPRTDKKMVAIFRDDSGRVVRTTHFGGKGYGDFTIYHKVDPVLARKKRLAYIRRHRVRENWRDPYAAGTLARWVLWEKPTVPASVRKYKVLFGFES